MSANILANPKAAAERGEQIYLDRFKELYEIEHPAKFVAINVINEQPYISETPEGAFDAAYADAPDGVFHLIQVGHAGAFRVSYPQSQDMDWIL